MRSLSSVQRSAGLNSILNSLRRLPEITRELEIAIISGALGALTIAGLLTKLGEALQWGEKFLGVMSSIKKMASTAIVITLGFALAKASFAKFMSDEGSFWDYVAGLLIGGAATWVLYSQWGG